MRPKLSSHSINRFFETYPYIITREQQDGLADIFSLYMPRGPIGKVVTYFRSGGGLPLYVGHAEYYDFDSIVRFLTQQPAIATVFRNSMFGGGKGADVPSMLASAAGETVERAVGGLAFFQVVDQLLYGTYSELTGRGCSCVGPAELSLFADEQFAQPDFYYERFQENTPLRWIEGKRLLAGNSVWAPAQLILPFYQLFDKESLIGYSTTGGLSCHVNERESLLHGILELMERDAANLHWNCGIAPARINIDKELTLCSLRRTLKESESLPVRPAFYLNTVDIPDVFVITAMGSVPGLKRRSYYAGGGVGLNIEEALLSAFIEYGQAEGTLRTITVAPDWDFSRATSAILDVPPDATARDIDIFLKIMSYYGYAENSHKLTWYINDGGTVPLSAFPPRKFETSEDRFLHLLSILKALEIDPIVFDFTPSQMQHLRITKVFIPELAPPYLQARPMLGNSRYYDIPVKLGWSDRRLTYDDLTKDPIPFP